MKPLALWVGHERSEPVKELRPQIESHSNQDSNPDQTVRPFHTVSQIAELFEISELSLYRLIKGVPPHRPKPK